MAVFKIDSFAITSAGTQAGLALGDAITHINGHEHGTLEELVTAISATDGAFEVSYIRSGRRGKVNVPGNSLGCKLVLLDEVPAIRTEQEYIRQPPRPKPEYIADPAPNKITTHSYRSHYETSLAINSFFAVIGYMLIIAGVVAAFVMGIRVGFWYGLYSFSLCIGGLAIVQFAHMARAITYTADHTREIMNLLSAQQQKEIHFQSDRFKN